MAKNIQVNEMASEIAKMLTEYTDEVTEISKKVVDQVSQEVMTEVKSHITLKDKKYSKAFASKKSFEDKRNKRNTWYVKPPYYRLTHLLEFGHVTRNGVTRSKAFPHVKYGDEFVQNNLERELEEAIQNARTKNNVRTT